MISPNPQPSPEKINETTSTWITKKISGGTNAYTFKYPANYFFDNFVLTNYDPETVANPGAPVDGELGKCHFGETEGIPSQGTELVNREKIAHPRLEIEKITEKDLILGPGPEINSYFVVGSDEPKISVYCYGKWQYDDAEVLSIIDTIEFIN